jgi:hypothetical protein
MTIVLCLKLHNYDSSSGLVLVIPVAAAVAVYPEVHSRYILKKRLTWGDFAQRPGPGEATCMCHAPDHEVLPQYLPGDPLLDALQQTLPQVHGLGSDEAIPLEAFVASVMRARAEIAVGMTLCNKSEI